LRIAFASAPGARPHDLPLPQLTLVGTTSKLWQVDQPLRRWCVACESAPYHLEEIVCILTSLSQDRGLVVDQPAARRLAERCNGSPGNAVVLLKRLLTHFPGPRLCEEQAGRPD